MSRDSFQDKGKTDLNPETVHNEIPKSVYEALARCFLPDISAYFESEEGKKEYAERK